MTPYGQAFLGTLRARSDRRGIAACPGGLAEGEVVPATGGFVKKRIGFLWFFPAAALRAKFEAITGRRPDESVELRVTFCNPTPGIFPVVGEFTDPGTGLHCFTDFAERDLWNRAWGRGGAADFRR